eukprot:CAMPEP_0184974606 /NCGR_PEP_ID=MMETSP1098-20130426/6062_1 /TAXON_ID=89044 /ORGANISM="Spumella elongata, Strain CCAP 955/1" /LENGTH=75 /DNA_ID=CAMNT_0027497219 /DNA_START=39 /DNA_END=266 /DNA_ORIENTATION=-
MPSTRSGGVSRNVQHGNNINKSGNTVAQFEKKAVVKAQRPMKVKKTPATSNEPTHTITDHTVIVAKANKLPKSIK